MNETQTFENILRRILERVPAKYDKREGALIYDSTAAVSVEIQNAYIDVDTAMQEVFADTASRECLIKHCAEQGISPKPASYAIVKGKFTPATLDIPVGSRYSHEDLNYIVTEKIEDGLYYLRCEMLGSEPNAVTGQLIPISYISGLETAEILEVTILGEDEEDTEALRARYFAARQAEAFGGNKLDYINKFMSISGVGGLKLYSGAQWNGGGTVLAVIKDSNNGVPTDDFIAKLQTDADPVATSGEGDGFAPIGHFVTVVPANETIVNVETNLTYDSGATWTSVREKVHAAVKDYLDGHNANWNHNSSPIVVRIAHLESAILDVPGVLDIQNTTINGKPINFTLDQNALAIKGTINGD